MTIPANITRWIIRIIWILFGIALVVLFGAGIQFKKRQLCRDINIEIKGAEKHMFIDEVDVKEIVNAKGNVIGKPIYTLSLRYMEAAVERNNWVKNAEMYVDNNQVLQIHIEERQPIARIFETTGNSYYIDTALVILPLSNKLTARVPVFTGVNPQQPKKDTTMLAQIAAMASYIVADSFFTAQIAQININEQKQFELVPAIGDHLVIFGDTTDLKARFLKLKSFYTQNWFEAGFDKYEKLDLQYRDQIVATKKGTAKMIADSAAAQALIATTGLVIPPVTDSAAIHDEKIKSLPNVNNKKTVKPLTNGVKPKKTKKHNLMNHNESPIIVGLDIGTTKIAAIAGRKNEYGKLEILGFGRANSHGVQHGQVLNIDQTIKAIQQALENCAQSNPDLEINEVYVGIAGHHIKSLQTRGDIVRQDPETEIQRWEIDQLINNQRKTFIPAGDQIIDVISQDFHVDSIQNIKDPVGYNGVKVGANFHIITGDRNAIRNINRAVDRSGLQTKDLVLQPLASASAVMSEIDMEAGVAILDIGGGTSDLAVFYEGILKHTAVIPFGGENITNDIRIGLGVLKSQAEAMKVQFGSALADEAKANAYITIPGLKGMPAKEISVKNLAAIIQARMGEILDFVTYHLKQVGLDHRALNGGIILTGGGSQLKHLIQLTEYTTGLNARIGLPNEHLAANHIDELKKPMYATCIGLILKGYNDYDHKYKEFNEKFVKVSVPEGLTKKQETGIKAEVETPVTRVDVTQRRERFWDKFKNNLIDLFKEEEDQVIR